MSVFLLPFLCNKTVFFLSLVKQKKDLLNYHLLKIIVTSGGA